MIGSPEGAAPRSPFRHERVLRERRAGRAAGAAGACRLWWAGVEERHGIVLAKSAQAKAAGVKTGEALWEAREVPGARGGARRYEVYQAYSAMARRIYHYHTDLVEPFGLDEAWLDLTGSLPLGR